MGFFVSEWMAEIVQTMAGTGSEWTQQHYHGSYAPRRENAPAQW